MPRAEFGSDFDNGVHAIRGRPSIYFPLATMLTFTSAVGKLNCRVLGQHHTLLQVISRSYCQVFVKSYNFVFEKINIQYAAKNQVKCISIRHVFCQKSTRKLRFCITSVLVSTNMSMTLFRKHFLLSKTIHKGPTVQK